MLRSLFLCQSISFSMSSSFRFPCNIAHCYLCNDKLKTVVLSFLVICLICTSQFMVFEVDYVFGGVKSELRISEKYDKLIPRDSTSTSRLRCCAIKAVPLCHYLACCKLGLCHFWLSSQSGWTHTRLGLYPLDLLTTRLGLYPLDLLTRDRFERLQDTSAFWIILTANRSAELTLWWQRH